MSKSQERRIEDVAEALNGVLTGAGVTKGIAWCELAAKRLLEIADREPPEWPTEESKRTFQDYAPYMMVNPAHEGPIGKRLEIGLRAAMLADPIIKAAIEYRDSCSDPNSYSDPQLIVDAVNEAGL